MVFGGWEGFQVLPSLAVGFCPHRACQASLPTSTGTGARSARALLKPASPLQDWAAGLVSEVAAGGCSLAGGPATREALNHLTCALLLLA